MSCHIFAITGRIRLRALCKCDNESGCCAEFSWCGATWLLGRVSADCFTAGTQEREGGMSPSSSQWPGNHAAERPEFYETLEASIKHVWLDKSSYETYAQALGVTQRK